MQRHMPLGSKGLIRFTEQHLFTRDVARMNENCLVDCPVRPSVSPSVPIHSALMYVVAKLARSWGSGSELGCTTALTDLRLYEMCLASLYTDCTAHSPSQLPLVRTQVSEGLRSATGRWNTCLLCAWEQPSNVYMTCSIFSYRYLALHLSKSNVCKVQ